MLQNKLKVSYSPLPQVAPANGRVITILNFADYIQDRKYFDSGDYALSKAGKAGDVGVTQVGREHPNPETIPHLSPTTSNTSNGSPDGAMGPRGSVSGPSGSISDGVRLPPAFQQMKSGSPVKENSMMHRSISADDDGQEGIGESTRKNVSGLTQAEREAAGAVSPPPQREGMPIRGGQ